MGSFHTKHWFSRRRRSGPTPRTNLRYLTIDHLEARRVLAAPVAVDDAFVTSQGVNLDSGLINGPFESGDLTGWTTYTTPGGTLGGTGFPDVVAFDIDGDQVETESLQMLVGNGGGGVYQIVRLAGGELRLSVDVAAQAPSANPDAGFFELLLDGQVIDSHHFDAIATDGVEYTTLEGTIEYVTPGDHEVRIRVTRQEPSQFGVSPFSLIDNVRTYTALESVLGNDSDADGDPLQTLLTSWPEHGSLHFRSDGSFNYVPDAAFVGEDSFSYRAVEPQQGYTLYSIDIVNDKLVTVDSTSGEISIVGSLLYDFQDADMAYLDGLLYAMDHHEVVTIDPATGEVLGITPIDLQSPSNTLNQTSGLATLGGEIYMTYGFCDNNCHANYMLGRYDRETGELVGLANYRDVSGGFNITYDALSANYSGQLIGTIGFGSGSAFAAHQLEFDPDRLSVLGIVTELRFNISDTTDVGPASIILDPTNELLVRFDPVESGYTRIRDVTALAALGDSLRGLAFAPAFETQQATVTISVLAEDLPLARPDAYTLVTGQVLQTSAADGLLANDLDQNGDELSISLVEDVGHGSLQLDGDGGFTYTPLPGFIGVDHFTYIVSDGEHDSNLAKVTLFVLTDNDPPVVVDDAFSTNEDDPLVIDAAQGILANDEDEDLDALAATLVDDVRFGELSLADDGSFTYVPNEHFFGVDQFSYRASDGEWDSNLATVTIDIASVNDPPLAVDDQYNLNEGEVLHTDTGQDDPFTETLVTQGALWNYLDDGSDQETQWREPGFDDGDWREGPAELGYGDNDEATVLDFGGNSNNKYATSYFRHAFEVDNAFRLQDVTLNVLYDDGVALYLNGVEIFRQNLAPDATFDTFAVGTVSDEDSFKSGGGDAALLVEGVNVLAAEIHQASGSSSDISFDLSLSATRLPGPKGVLDNDSDAEGDALSILLVAPPQNGGLALNPDGSFQYLPDEDFVGVDAFSYRASDGTDDSNTATVTITVNKVNSPPSAEDDQYTLIGGDILNIGPDTGVLLNDRDEDGQALTATLVSEPTHGAVVLNPDGSFRYAARSTFGVSDTFTYRASDGLSDSDVATVTILADVPVIHVGDHQLAVGVAGQAIDIMVTGGHEVTGVNIRAQLGDGTGPGLEPRFESVDFSGGIWDAFETTTGGGPVPGVEQFVQANIQFGIAGEATPAEGRLIRLVLDTTGIPVGAYELRLQGTEIGVDTDFVGTPAHIVNGTITVVSPEVAGRRVFYNNSYHDGDEAEINDLDDAALATDKTGLLPGQTATFSNYTSYNLGINGIMVDVAGLTGTPTVNDFHFHVGNDNEPAMWADAPNPSGLVVRDGAGVGGSDRITITWPDRAIRNEWLRVTMLATANTNLTDEDVFYIGNAIGEAGDTPNATFVDGTDFALPRDNPRNFLNRAPVDFPYDYNRDSFVDGFDLAVARDNGTNFLTALKLITAPDLMPPGGNGLALFEPRVLEREVGVDEELGEVAVMRRFGAVDLVFERGLAPGQPWRGSYADDESELDSLEELLKLLTEHEGAS